MKNIFDYTLEDLENLLISSGFKKFNATQVVDWIYKKKIYNFDEMSNLSKNLISFMKENFYIKFLELDKCERSKSTVKYLFRLVDGSCIETVLMKHDYGNSLCVSSQVGCNMGCAFCESGRLKKIRNLSVGEMVGQITTVERLENIEIGNVVVMGIGEPFDNYDNLIKFLSIVTNGKMIEIGQRKVTVSTCGVVPKILEFANLQNQVNLAISLHAPNDELRNKLMPINKVYPIKDVFRALDDYMKITNRRITIEYILINDVNDGIKEAEELSSLLRGKLVYVNLIPYNPTNNSSFKRSNDFKIKKFYDILKKNRIEVIIRKEMGPAISAACGQLRARK